jgi:hypothetical protein
MLDSYTLAGYVLREWKQKLGINDLCEYDDINFFINDLRHQCGMLPLDTSFFQILKNLDVGPIRVFVSGSCSTQDLDEIIQMFFDKTSVASSWRERFDTLAMNFDSRG